MLLVAAGPLAGLATLWALDGAVGRGDLPQAAATVAGVAVLMCVWWISEAVPIEVTGLVPLVAFPLLGVAAMKDAASPYADPIIFLFLGGMLLGRALEVWHLHTRFALGVLTLFGTRPASLVMGFLFTTAFVSMWVSNTAATVMMLPIGISVAGMVAAARGESVGESAAGATGGAVVGVARDTFPRALVLAIAFGASIGGVGTLIGTPPIALYASHMQRSTGNVVTFGEWMLLGVPTLLVVAPLCGLVLTRVAFRVSGAPVPALRRVVTERLAALGAMGTPQWFVTGVFVLAAAGWVTSSWTKIHDATIGIAAALLLFAIPAFGRGRSPAGLEGGRAPARALLTWREAERVPWGVLLLFGGGLSLASAIDASGLDSALAGLGGGLAGAPLLLVLFVVALASLLLTEFTNNTALVAAALPIGESLATALGVPPGVVLVTITLSASLGFAMPGGTAPNALAFSTGLVPMGSMVRARLLLDVVVAVVVPLVVYGAFRAGVLPGG